LFWLPSAHARTIRARSARACAVFRRDASDINSKRSAWLSSNGANTELPTATSSLKTTGSVHHD
jgi:hypothetical protein